MFAQASRSIPCFGTTHADTFYGEVPLTRPMGAKEVGENYEANTGRVIAERFQDFDPQAIPGVLVMNHGPFTWGATPAAAVEHAVIVEEVAKMAWGTLVLNPDARPVPQYLLDKHYQRKHGPAAYYGQKIPTTEALAAALRCSVGSLSRSNPIRRIRPIRPIDLFSTQAPAR